jgi:hypothetical protein
MVLPPGFLEALRRVVPRRRRAKLRYIVGLGLVAFFGIVAADPSTREFVAARWRHAAPVGSAAATTIDASAKPGVPAASVAAANPMPHPVVDRPAPVPTTAPPATSGSTIGTGSKRAQPRRAAPGAAAKTQGT